MAAPAERISLPKVGGLITKAGIADQSGITVSKGYQSRCPEK